MNAISRITPRPKPLAGLRHPGTLLALALVGAVHLAAWWGLNRPVALPDAPAQIAGLAFAPYQRGQTGERGPGPTEAQIEDDLHRIAPLTRRIRTYGVDGSLGRIPALAAGLDLRVTLGAWLDTRATHNAAELRRLVAIARASRNVDRVLVGNEAVLRRDQTPAQIIAAMDLVRRQIRQPVSTAEPWHVWLDHPELGRAADFITIHLLPYWEGLSAEDANRRVMANLDRVRAAFPGKPIVIGEVGWPSDGRDIGAARASIVNQAGFLRRFFVEAQARGLDYFVMEAFDQPWKTAFEGRAAGYWGMFDLDRAPKWPRAGAVSETPGWMGWAAGSTLLALLVGAVFLAQRPDIRLVGKVIFAGLVQGFVASIALVILAMSDTYLSTTAAAVWALLIAGQGLLLLLLVGDSFDLAETVFGTRWKRRFAALPAAPGTRQPKVSLHLAICNEPPEMVAQTLNALAALDYANFEVLVIDNNTMDPRLWEPVEQHCARLGPKFRFFHLGKYPGFKAGALNFALRATAAHAEIIGVLDSDYLAAPDWLARMVPFFQNPEVGFTQSPQDYRDAGPSAFKRMMFWEYAGFFRAGMVTRNERDAIIQHGTMTLIRASALRDAKGWAEWTICEDSELGLRLMRAGWRAVYVPASMGRGVMPDDFAAYRKQRFRWAQGAVQIVKFHAEALFNPFDRSLTTGQRWHFVMGWMPWFGDALGLAFLAGSLAWSAGLVFAPVRTDFPILLFMLPSLGLFAFKLVQLWMLYAARVECGPLDRLGAAIGGLALTHTIGKAVWMGLTHRRAAFLRTPKMADAPALVQGVLMVREEALVLLALWAAIAGVAWRHGGATSEAVLWCVVLGVQSIPYVSAIGVSLLAAMPARRALEVASPAPVVARVREMA